MIPLKTSMGAVYPRDKPVKTPLCRAEGTLLPCFAGMGQPGQSPDAETTGLDFLGISLTK